jgi:uroporphyrinogen decarboxylase
VESLTHWERVQAAIEGGPLDHPPIALWRHWPDEDQDAAAFARATLGWQHAYDFDVVKITPNAPAGVADWGLESRYDPQAKGIRLTTRFPVRDLADWAKLKRNDPQEGHLGREVNATRRVAHAIEGRAPVLQTVFSPLTLARKLADMTLFDHIREDPRAVERALGVIAETAAAFAAACVRAGADGIYFATQCASRTVLDSDGYRRFGRPYDLHVLEAIRKQSRLVIMHVHGEDILFDDLLDYPVDILNWHDRRTPPALHEGHARFEGAVLGGIDEEDLLCTGPASAIKAQVAETIRLTGGRRVMLGGGCVVPLAAPEANIRAAIAAVRGG